MTATLVGSAQAIRIQDAGWREADGVFQRRSADEAHVPHLLEIVLPTEGPREGDFPRVIFGRHFHFERLPADGRGILRVAGERKTIRGHDADPFALVFHRDGAADAQVAAFAAIVADAGLFEKAYEGRAA